DPRAARAAARMATRRRGRPRGCARTRRGERASRPAERRAAHGPMTSERSTVDQTPAAAAALDADGARADGAAAQRLSVTDNHTLSEPSYYFEVANIITTGALPTRAQLEEWVGEITIHTFVHENIKSFMQGSRYDANPMGMLVASVGALSTFYPDANRIDDDF